jgi:hypothetical protein
VWLFLSVHRTLNIEKEKNVMKTFVKSILFTGALVMGANGLIAAPAAGAPGSGPVIKNLMALTKRPADTQKNSQRQFTKREVKRLSATAESHEDHFKLARYYNEKADSLDAEAAGYKEAAAVYRNGPIVKNLMSPTTPERYEYHAKTLRDEANSDRQRAEAQKKMAQNAVATIK